MTRIGLWMAILAVAVWGAAAAGGLPVAPPPPGGATPSPWDEMQPDAGSAVCVSGSPESPPQSCTTNVPASESGDFAAAPVIVPASTAPGPSAQALQGVSLSPPQQTVAVTSAFSLDVLVNCAASADAASVVVSFSPTYMHVISVTQDLSSFPDVLRDRFDNVSGTLWYDAGSMLCHSEDSCPTGVVRLATIAFQPLSRTSPTTYVGIHGQVTWSGELIFDGEGSGSAIEIVPTDYQVNLPLVLCH